MAYNKNVLPPQRAPRGWADLVKPEFKGRKLREELAFARHRQERGKARHVQEVEAHFPRPQLCVYSRENPAGRRGIQPARGLHERIFGGEASGTRALIR